MIIPRWADRYSGVPYDDDGHTLEAASCWGICRLVLWDRARIATKPYGGVSSKDLLQMTGAFNEGRDCYSDFVMIPKAERYRLRALDLVLMKSFDLPKEYRDGPSHIGIMVSESAMLHVLQAAHSHCVDVDSRAIKARILSFHRHRSLDGPDKPAC